MYPPHQVLPLMYTMIISAECARFITYISISMINIELESLIGKIFFL